MLYYITLVHRMTTVTWSSDKLSLEKARKTVRLERDAHLHKVDHALGTVHSSQVCTFSDSDKLHLGKINDCLAASLEFEHLGYFL